MENKKKKKKSKQQNFTVIFISYISYNSYIKEMLRVKNDSAGEYVVNYEPQHQSLSLVLDNIVI